MNFSRAGTLTYLLPCLSHSPADYLELRPFTSSFIHGCPHAKTIWGASTLHCQDSLWRELLGWDGPRRYRWLLKFSRGKGSAECDFSLRGLMPFRVVSASVQEPGGIWLKGRFGKAGEKRQQFFEEKKVSPASESRLLFPFFYSFSFFYIFLCEKFYTHTQE